METMQCPCGSGRELAACCGPYLEGTALPAAPEALMRSRYTAHCLGRYDYLVDSTHPQFRDELSAEEIKEWSELMSWQELEILETRNGAPEDETGEVSFLAHYTLKGMPQKLREDAFFRKEEGRWYYVEGTVHGAEPARRESPKIGRNDPCPCGSGKKYKKCCMPA